jgi:antitoxin VapB
MELVVDPAEVAEKDRRLREFMTSRGLAGLLLSGAHRFAWATGGRDNRVARAAAPATGVGHALYTPDAKYLLCDNVEEPRLRDEERLEEQGFTFVTAPWYAFDLAAEARKRVPGGGAGTLGADTPLPGATLVADRELAPLRYSLTPAEIGRYRWLGRVTAAAMESTAYAIEPGMREVEVGAVLEHFLGDEGVTSAVTLVASDARIARYRHPLPTAKPVEHTVMYVTGATRFGLHASATRLVCFGRAPVELARRHDAVCAVDTIFNTHTRPGARVADIFAAARAAYALQGFADEWTLHHQGGATGYSGRDYKATPDIDETVRPRQAFAWNPSITGTKSEDTLLAADAGPEILTAASRNWPTRRVETPRGALDRPLILER